MKVHSFFKVHRILTELGTNSKLIYLMQVILLVVGHEVISEDEGKHGGGVMWLTVPSRKKDDSGKSGRKMEIKNISKQKGRQSQLSTLLQKVRKKPNLVMLKAMINEIKSLKKLIG